MASYPAVAFFELSRHILCTQQVTDEDLELLHSFVSMIHTLADWAEETSYMKRLSKFSSTILQLTNCRRENTSSRSSGADSTPPRPSLVTSQAYMHTMGIYPGAPTSAAAEVYGSGSAGSSSTHSNSTPASGGMQPRRPMTDTETVAVPETATSTAAISSSLGSFDGGFDSELTPMDELEGWIVDPRLGDTIHVRSSLQPDHMAGFMLQDKGYTFGGIELG